MKPNTHSLAILGAITSLYSTALAQSIPGTPAARYSADTGLNTSGNTITSWNDQSGSKHLDQVIGTPTALSQTTASGVKSVVNLDGNDAIWIAKDSFSYDGDRTIVIYARVNDTNDGFLFDGSSETGMSRAQIRSNQWQVGLQTEGNGDNADGVTTNVSTGVWQTHTFVFDNFGNVFSGYDTYVRHYVNGTQVHWYHAAAGHGLDGLILGANVSGSRKLNVDIAEVLFYDSVLSQTDVTSAHNYMNSRWGQPNNTDMTHSTGIAEQSSLSLLPNQSATYPLIALRVDTQGSLNAFDLTAFRFDLTGTTNTSDISALKVYAGEASPDLTSTPDATITSGFDSTITVNLNETLTAGANYVWVAVETNSPISEGNVIDATIIDYTINGPDAGTYAPTTTAPSGSLTVGDGVYSTIVRKGGDDGSGNFRIPALVTTNAGTLIAGYDVRWNGNDSSSPDLPANIDVGIQRSTDGGITWEPMQIIMDYDQNVSGSQGNGVGDPSLLVDRSNGRIWCAALWSKGNNAWNGSGPGLDPDDTGQFVVNYSDDDGLTWSAPVSITTQIKDTNWNLYFNGPGKGFSTRNGTLIFPAQYRDSSGVPRSNFIYSTDQGATWHHGAPAIADGSPWTTESQMVELDNGDLLISMRNHDSSKKRLWCVYSWNHETETIADGSWGTPWYDQDDPTVMGSVQRYSSVLDGQPSSILLFSNPDSASAREKMTIRASLDEGSTWAYSRKIDDRPAAYSCMTILPNGNVGILYETGETSNIATLVFMRFPLSWVVGDTDTDSDGMSDFYEDTNGLDKNNDADANQDADGDGQTNLEEFLANTNANSASSTLAITSMGETSTERTFSWQSTPNKYYIVEESTTLAEDSWTAVSGLENVWSLSTQHEVTIPKDASGKKFYRVRAK